jgi:hypothetical protein
MRKALSVFLILFTAALAVGGYLSYQNRRMDQLFKEGSGQIFKGSAESSAAIKKLAAYHSRKSSRLLVDIALARGQGVPLTSDLQVEAIRALRESADPEVAVALASLLQPYCGLDVREAAAQSLQGLTCKGECVLSIAHYLERIWRGELNYEDTFIPGGASPATSLKKEQNDLYEALYSILRREQSGTMAVLRDVYGVGSSSPSPFALDLLSRLRLPEACPLLLGSERQINVRPANLFHASRQELKTAMASLHCK